MALKIGQKIIHLSSIDSTNNYVAKLIKSEKIMHGTVILADEQTAGRGQRGNSWLSESGNNLLCSIYLTPVNLTVENGVVLSHFISVSLIHFLEKLGISGAIKWPNDIYVNKKKIAGILIENTLAKSLITHSIIGVGINVNQTHFGNLHATSIKDETGNFYSIYELMLQFSESLNTTWDNLAVNNANTLRNEYLNHLYLKDVPAKFTDETGSFTGIIRGITESGLLRVEKSEIIAEYDLKQIQFTAQNDV
jgi:BirA family biotin operon repressor/biotin-[acetyl-CoA-carboxylase] ligase